MNRVLHEARRIALPLGLMVAWAIAYGLLLHVAVVYALGVR